jgi:hypothetical protein
MWSRSAMGTLLAGEPVPVAPVGVGDPGSGRR